MVHPGEQHQVQDALQQTVMLEGTMVDRNKYGAIRELARFGTAKKEIARQLEVTVKTVRRAHKKPQWEPYQRPKPTDTVLSQFDEWATSRAEEVNFNAATAPRHLCQHQVRKLPPQGETQSRTAG